MRSRKALGIALVAAAASLAGAAGSYAATTTIGPPTLSSGTMNDPMGGTYIEYSGTTPAPEYVSPINGTIVRWRIASGSAGSPVRLRVLRPAGGGEFTGVGTSALEMTTSSPPDTFATSIPIKVGDIIGVDNSSSALMFTTGDLGAYPELFSPALADGSSAKPEPRALDKEFRLEINADIEPAPGGSGGSGGGGGGGGGNSGGGDGNGGGAQPGSPTLTALKLSPNAFSAAGSGGSIAKNKKTGAIVSYTDSQPATTTFTVLQGKPGRTKRGACIAPGRKPHGKRCTRWVTIGSFTHTDTAGANSFRFTGRVNGHKLKPGSYRLRALARNASGAAGAPLTAAFHIKKG